MTPEDINHFIENILGTAIDSGRAQDYRRIMQIALELSDDQVHRLADAVVDTVDKMQSAPGCYILGTDEDGFPVAVPKVAW